MPYKIVVLLDEGVTSVGAHAIAEEIKSEFTPDEDVIAVEVHRDDPRRG